MIDHTGVMVTDLDRSTRFYRDVLATLGYELMLSVPAYLTGRSDAVGYGVPPKVDFWLGVGKPGAVRCHVAFRAPSRAAVDAFHRVALSAGAADHGRPGLRPQYHEHYYAAFVLDPDGHNIEAVCHQPP